MKFNASLLTVGIAATATLIGSLATAAAPANRYTTTSGTVNDSMTKLTWQRAVPYTTYTWAASATYCSGLGATLGGSGWRLPTVKELLTLIDDSRSNPAIDPDAFPSTPTGNAWFWSSTSVTGATSTTVWAVDFKYGQLVSLPPAGPPVYTRCVR